MICNKCHKDKEEKCFELRDKGKYRRKTCYACNERSPRRRFASYRYGAKTRRYEWNISREEFMTFWDKNCYYCGEKIFGIGLDRINNNKGYTIDNIVPCCKDCNTMKMSLSIEEFFSKIDKIYNKYHNIG